MLIRGRLAKLGSRACATAGRSVGASRSERGSVVTAADDLVASRGLEAAGLVRGKIDGAERGRRSARVACSTGAGGPIAGAPLGTASCSRVGTAFGGLAVGVAGSAAMEETVDWSFS